MEFRQVLKPKRDMFQDKTTQETNQSSLLFDFNLWVFYVWNKS